LTYKCSAEHFWVANPKELQDLLDELEALSCFAQKGMGEFARDPLDSERYRRHGPTAAGTQTIDLEGRLAKDGVRKAIMDRKTALTDLVHAVRQYRKLAELKPLTHKVRITQMPFWN
jgi:hypothetical protein